jgi:hypothetical protein
MFVISDDDKAALITLVIDFMFVSSSCKYPVTNLVYIVPEHNNLIPIWGSVSSCLRSVFCLQQQISSLVTSTEINVI